MDMGYEGSKELLVITGERVSLFLVEEVDGNKSEKVNTSTNSGLVVLAGVVDALWEDSISMISLVLGVVMALQIIYWINPETNDVS